LNKKIKNVILVLGVAAMWVWFYKSEPYKKIKVQSPSLSKDTLVLDIPSKSTFQASSEALSEVRRCFQGNEKLKPLLQKPQFQFQDLNEVKDFGLKEFERIDIHFNFEGKRLRLAFNGKKAEDLHGNLQLFQVNENGLEEKRPIPKPWLEMKPLEILRWVKSEFPVTKLQRRIHWQMEDSTDLRFSDENGDLRDLRLITGSPSGSSLMLHCESEGGPLSCQCVSLK
jgi:hypothetical protein